MKIKLLIFLTCLFIAQISASVIERLAVASKKIIEIKEKIKKNQISNKSFCFGECKTSNCSDCQSCSTKCTVA